MIRVGQTGREHLAAFAEGQHRRLQSLIGPRGQKELPGIQLVPLHKQREELIFNFTGIIRRERKYFGDLGECSGTGAIRIFIKDQSNLSRRDFDLPRRDPREG